MNLTVKPVADLRVGGTYTLTIEEELQARTGEVTVITGDSGTGKSVLLKLLAGYHPRRKDPDRAFEAYVQAGTEEPPIPIDEFLTEPTRLSYLPQHSVLRPQLTPARAISDWTSILSAAYGDESEVPGFVSRAAGELQEKLFSPGEQAQLFGDNPPRIKHLSGGQKRRLDVILALCSPAEVILLDEPDSGLDETRRSALFATLVDFAERYNKIILLVSHYATRELPMESMDAWTITREPEGGGRVTAARKGDHEALALQPHAPPEARGDMRLDQFLTYVRQRFTAMRNRTTASFIVAPLILMAVVRLAIYPDPVADGPSMGLLFFFAIACFWLGTVQSTGFWTDEHALFSRECRQGASSFSFVFSFITSLAVILCAQAVIGALALKYLAWSAFLGSKGPAPGADLHIGWLRIALWGAWAGGNGMLAGLTAATIQHRCWPRATSPTTAQILALLITLSAIVFSYPIIGNRAYERVVENVHSPDRLKVLHQAASHIQATESPVPAILLAEAPWAANPSFHGLWFQGERPRRYDLSPAIREEFQKQCVPALVINALLLALLAALSFRLSWQMTQGPEYA